MRGYRLDSMTRGWFVGDFEPTAFKTSACEVGVKTYKKGDIEDRHYHAIATELTVIAEGKVELNGKKYLKGDIIVIEPGEDTDFKALTDVTTVVVKIPGAKSDKYLGKK
jgi:quercetin dioxygenase-like cupin family protein